MLTKKMFDALNKYYLIEFDHGADDVNENSETIGVAFTNIYDESGNDCHEMQIDLNLHDLQFEYYLDNTLIHVEKHESEDEIVDVINNTDFQGWYEDFLNHCPEDYH